MANDRTDGSIVEPFTAEFLYLTGISVRSVDPTIVATFNWFYDEMHIPEVFAGHAGLVGASRYEVITQDSAGDFSPHYLAAYELADESSRSEYLDREAGRGGGSFHYSALPTIWPDLLDTRWRMLYRRIARVGDSTEAASSILAIAMDPPADAGPDELAEFNDFYTRTHLPKVVADSRFLRGTRYELSATVTYPSSCPRYLAVYEADTRKTADHVRSRLDKNGPAPAEPEEGPPVWRNRTTAWRVRYRRTLTAARPRTSG